MAEKEAETASYLAAGKMFEPGRLIMDPAMLKLLPIDKLRDITVIAMRANIAATEAYLKAQQNIVEEVQKIKM
jgi:hypothetical protein